MKPAEMKFPAKTASGFTLIELLVVIFILSVLVTMSIITINPIKQLQKARDAKVEYNLKQINSALDLYYNDNNKYPVKLVFGDTLKAANENTVYMNQIPQDPDCANGGSCYYYMTDSSNLQWNVLFTKVYNLSNSSVSCPLKNMIDSAGKPCVPRNYDESGYNYCVLSGNVDCSFIREQDLPKNAGKGTGGSGSGGVPIPSSIPSGSTFPTPTPAGPTPTPTPAGPTPTPYCLCANTNSHIYNYTQGCQGGGYNNRFNGTFVLPVLAYYCPNVTNNCTDSSGAQAATNCQ